METVFRSSFLLALTCSKRICFPPDTDSFLCVKEWGWSIWGPVPGGAGLAGKRGAGRTACLAARLRGGCPAEFRRPSRRNVRPLAPYTNPAGLPASPGSVYRKSFFSPEDPIKKRDLSRPLYRIGPLRLYLYQMSC